MPTSLWLEETGALATTLPLPIGETFTYAGVPRGTYTLRARAANATGVTPPSNAATLTFPGNCDGRLPLAPTNLQTWLVGRTIFLSWNPPVSGAAAAQYQVGVRGAYLGAFYTAGRTLSGAAAPGIYYISIRGMNACGFGVPTAEQVVVIP